MTTASGIITVAKGIEIQARHLAEWKSVLKPDVYAELESWATATNVQAETGLDIRRGQTLDTFVHNELMEPRRAKKV
jgi:hypothetical protein